VPPADVDEPRLDVQRCGSTALSREDPAPNPDLVAVREQRQRIQARTVRTPSESPARAALLEYEPTVGDGHSARHDAIPPQALHQVEFEVETDQFAAGKAYVFSEQPRVETPPASFEPL